MTRFENNAAEEECQRLMEEKCKKVKQYFSWEKHKITDNYIELFPFVKRLAGTTPSVGVEQQEVRTQRRKKEFLQVSREDSLQQLTSTKQQHQHSLHKPIHFDMMPNSKCQEANLNPNERECVWKQASARSWVSSGGK